MKDDQIMKQYTVNINLLKDFERKYFELLELSKYIDKKIEDRIESINNEVSLCKTISNIAIFLEINATAYTEGKDLRDLYTVDIKTIVAALTRLISLSRRVNEIYEQKLKADDEIFKPSNINNEQILLFLDTALDEIKKESNITNEEKKILNEYIESAKVEMQKKIPGWRKIVGTLVIVSTLLGGIAIAPKAYENVKNALNHIFGTSIVKNIPNMIRPYEKLKLLPNDNETTIT